MIIRKVSDDGKHSVFVQKSDIKMIAELDLMAPASLFLPFINSGETITDENQNDFIEYDEDDVWLFVSKQNWILNFDELSSFSVEELLILKNQLFTKIDSLRLELKNSKLIEKRINLKLELKKKKYFLSSILFFEKVKNQQLITELLSNSKKNLK